MYRSPSCTLCHLVLVLDTKPVVHTVHIPLELTGGEECQQKRQASAQTHTELHAVTDRTASTCSCKVGPFDLSRA